MDIFGQRQQPSLFKRSSSINSSGGFQTTSVHKPTAIRKSQEIANFPEINVSLTGLSTSMNPTPAIDAPIGVRASKKVAPVPTTTPRVPSFDTNKAASKKGAPKQHEISDTVSVSTTSKKRGRKTTEENKYFAESERRIKEWKEQLKNKKNLTVK